MTITATKVLEFDAAHRLLNHESKCANLHGHRYRAEITVWANSLDEVGRVIDFGCVKELVGGWIDKNLDHACIVNFADRALIEFLQANNQRKYVMLFGEPSAENMARDLLDQAQVLLAPKGVAVRNVRLYETPSCFVDCSVDDLRGSKS